MAIQDPRYVTGVHNQNGYGDLYKKVDANGRTIGAKSGITVDPADLQRLPPNWYNKDVQAQRANPSAPPATDPPQTTTTD